MRHVVLELGTASTELLALLGRSRCRVEVADVAHFGGIERLNNAASGPELAGVAESLLPNRLSDEGIDFILCWDLLNYLSLDGIAALMRAIAGRTRAIAFAHALIAYSDREMPANPGRFVPTPESDLINRSDSEELIGAPRYSPSDLANNIDGFVIDRARLLANGMQEFMFRLES